MDKANFWPDNVDIQKRLKEAGEHKARIKKLLPKYCKVLDIDISLVDDKIHPYGSNLFDLETAAKIKPKCEECSYTVENCKECQYIQQLYDVYSSKNAYLKCKKYEKYKRLLSANRRTKILLRNSGLGKRFEGRRFETFNVSGDTKQAFDACVKFCDTFSEDSKGIRLVGTYGCGKTHLAAAIIHRLAENGIGGVFVVVPELLRAIRKSYNQPGEDTEKLMGAAEEAPLLVLDDLGAEKPSDWVREQLYVIINRRYENMLPTIVTTNCSTQELVDRIGQRTVSRLIEMTTPYKITAKDYRMGLA